MTSSESEPTPEFNEQNLGILFNKFKDIAQANGGDYELPIGDDCIIEVNYVPAGTLSEDERRFDELDEPSIDQLDEPRFDELAVDHVDRIIVRITNLIEPDITVSKDFEVMESDTVIPEMVSKDLEISSNSVVNSYRAVLRSISPSKEEAQQTLKDVLDFGGKLIDMPLNENLDDPHLDIPFEYLCTTWLINPDFLQKHGAPSSIVSIAQKMVEIANENLHAFNAEDFKLLKHCLEILDN